MVNDSASLDESMYGAVNSWTRVVLLDPERRDPHACTLRGPRRQALRDDRLGLAVRRGEDVATAQ